MALELPEIHLATKVPSFVPHWIEAENKQLRLVIPLEIDGVTIEGLVLRGQAYKDRPDEAVTFQLECNHPGRRDRAIDRMDWKPLNSHNNGGSGPPEHRFAIIQGSHHHSFELNWLENENRMRNSNLPIAIPIDPELNDFEALIDFVKERFRIKRIEIPIPPWEADLL